METWWIHKPIVMGSSNPTVKMLRQFYQDGFRVIISLLDESEQTPICNVNKATAMGYIRHSIPVLDWSPPTLDQLSDFLDIVDWVNGQGKIIVHCQGGTGRTGTMAAAYWIKRGIPAEEAIRRMRQANERAIGTSSQEQILHQFAESLSFSPRGSGGE